MNTKTPIFFCAIGGSGMLPLALIMKSRGYEVRGSDRMYDQGRATDRFDFIKASGIQLFPQDGSGVTADVGQVIVSSAVEPTVPDYKAATNLQIPVVLRARLLADIFNAAETSLAIAGTSGKSTVTGMTGWILHQAGRNPTVMNGAVMKNFITPDMPVASALIGNPDLFVAEVDESDGSIEMFMPKIAILNNIAIDHKSMDELRVLFRSFVSKAQTTILNLDNAETAALAADLPNVISYSLENPAATLLAHSFLFRPEGVTFTVRHTPSAAEATVSLRVPGHHNVSNALAAMGASLAVGIDFAAAAQILNGFTGMRRRLEVVGEAAGVTVIDDFAHNPDKIGATLRTLHQFAGRLLILFQPHGFGPLRTMRQELVDCFCAGLRPGDQLFMPDPLYLGGTVNRSVSSSDLVNDIVARGSAAICHEKRETCADEIVALARPGDRIVVMGARDDTLPQFARDILERVGSGSAEAVAL